MKTLNCHFGLKLVRILSIFLVSCFPKDNNTCELVCNISYLGKSDIIIEMQNYSNNYFYLQRGRSLIGGIRIFRVSKNTNSIDLTAVFRNEIVNHFEYLLTKSCEDNFKEENIINRTQLDSTIYVIYKLNNFLDKEEWPNIRELVHGILMIKPGQIFKECFKLPAAFSKDTLVIFYQYPYKSVWDYQTLSEDLKAIVAKYERIRLPDEILGYKRYKNVVLQSNYLIYYPSN